uniref:Cupin-like domain-containing protein n=1 Tax=Clastoptera arizonana TaxID=38151 RepID=A0A1B6CT62_9HEMI
MEKMDDLIEEYKEEVSKLCNLGKSWNLTDEQIDEVIENSFQKFEKKHQNIEKVQLKLCKIQRFRITLFAIAIIVLLSIYLILQTSSFTSLRKSINNYVERNVQEIIYPGMKLFRKLMLPIIITFPSLTAWYDETCLVLNPYFQVSDMDCWPCENVRSILNLTGSNIEREEYHSGIPFIYKEESLKDVNFKKLRKMYFDKKEVFDRDASRVTSDRWNTVEELMEGEHFVRSESNDSHVMWRLNRLEPTRIARGIFGSPQNIPYYTTGSTPEKFILLDEPNTAPYQLPATEGSTVFLVQGSGSRMVVLTPAPECKKHCHRVSVVLQPNHVLWYNWWYWRASSFPLIINKEISVTYVGSFF